LDSVREIVKLGVVASTCRTLGYDAGKEENVLKHLTVDAMFLFWCLLLSATAECRSLQLFTTCSDSITAIAPKST
jgi:hypothetical protein